MLLAALLLGMGGAQAQITQETKDRALRILERIAARDPQADDRYVEALDSRVAAAQGIAKLQAMHELLYFSLSGDEVQTGAEAILSEAELQDNESYAAIARSRLIYLDFKQNKTPTALSRLQTELDRAESRGDWLAETQIRRLITYVLWSQGHRETALQMLQAAFDRLPEEAAERDFARLTLLDAVQFIHADSGDLVSLVETAEQILETAERAKLPINEELIVRNFAYLFRLRGEYETALKFYEAYDQLLDQAGQSDRRYISVFGLALTAQRMGAYRQSREYADQALNTDGLPALYRAAFQVIQAINDARAGAPESARRRLEQARSYFDEGGGAGSEFWQIEMLHADAEIARAEGRFEQAMEMLYDYMNRSVASLRAETAQDVKEIRAELSAELARQQAERALLERDQRLNRQRIRMQMTAIGFLTLLIGVLVVAYIQQQRNAKALEQSRRKAEAANEAKSRFLANISHELRTPLNAVIGFSDMLVQAGPAKMGRERVEEYAGLINQSGRHLLDVIADLLDVSQIESGGIELSVGACTLSDLTRDALNIVAPQAEAAGKRVELSLAPDLPSLLVDRRRLKQALINLLSNALKFTGRDARIVLSAERTETGELAIRVRDNGIGIPADKIDTVLDPFVQVDDGWNRSHHGVGLGLSIVRTIVEAHGGRLVIESRVGKGTCVSILLPADCMAEAAAEPPNPGAKTAVA